MRYVGITTMEEQAVRERWREMEREMERERDEDPEGV